MQGRAADASQLQMKLLNCSKGAGVRALSAQIDKIVYHKFYKKLEGVSEDSGLIVGEAEEGLVKTNQAVGL